MRPDARHRAVQIHQRSALAPPPPGQPTASPTPAKPPSLTTPVSLTASPGETRAWSAAAISPALGPRVAGRAAAGRGRFAGGSGRRGGERLAVRWRGEAARRGRGLAAVAVSAVAVAVATGEAVEERVMWAEAAA